MKLLGIGRSEKQTSIQIEQIVKDLRDELVLAEGTLKSAKEGQAKIPFDGGDAAAVAKKVREAEADVERLKDSIKLGVSRFRETRAEEFSAQLAPIWRAMQKAYLRCHKLAQEIESTCAEIADLEDRYRVCSSGLQAVRHPAPKRIKTLAVRKFQDSLEWGKIGAAERRTMNETILRFLNSDEIPAGRNYSETEIAAIMGVMASLTIAEASSNEQPSS